ncbi:MAG: type I-C CRISPR-associated protein Cas8c/Csd1 [Phycisphaerae bacterium]
MILKRLYELAEREKLLDDPAFESLPVPIIVKVGDGGKYLGVEDRHGVTTIPSKKGPPKTKPGRGRELPVPKPHGNTANAGFARYFADTLARVLPISDEKKSLASRATFWRQMAEATTATNDPALRAVSDFGQAMATNPQLVEQICVEVATIKPGPGDRCTFAWFPDEGLTILDRQAVKTWWREFYKQFDQARQGEGPRGICQVTGELGPIATVHATKLSGIPGGIASGVSLISNDKQAFESYGLEGAANAAIGYRAVDGYTRAIQALVQEKLHRSTIISGGDIFLFWGREKGEDDALLACLDGTNPDLVAKLLESAHSGKEAKVVNENTFYCLALSGNSARAVVRDYLEAPISEVKNNLRQWFSDLRIISPLGNELTTAFPLWQLALATARDSEAVAPTVPPQLLAGAIKGQNIGEGILALCLRRLQAEGTRGFTSVRLGLIKLILIRKGITMGEQVMDAGREAYVCGRLMAVFERAQWGALGDVNANVVDKFYSTASTAPGLVFPRLFKSAQQHISKLENDKPGMATNIKKDIEDLCSKVKDFPHLLKLDEQGKFALGFYHQRAEYRRQGEANRERREEQKQAAQS